MKYSLRLKLTSILIIIVSCVIFITWFLNMAFAEQYYELSEKKNVIQTYRRIDQLLYKESEKTESEADEEDDSDESSSYQSSDESGDETLNEDLVEMCNRADIRMMITEPDNDELTQKVIYTNLILDSSTYHELLWYLQMLQTRFAFERNFSRKGSQILDQFSLFDGGDNTWSTLVNEGYIIRMMRNLNDGHNGIYLFGYTKDKHFVGMMVPMENIKTSAAISSRFFAYIGLVGILFGSIAIFIVSTRFTKPIRQMAGVADRMSQLDFDAKIDIDTEDELELLGRSMNTLSKTLESTIADLKSANLELQKDIEKKEQIDEMRKEFLSHVSHELKTPIALIQGYAEGLSENIMDDEESKEFYCEVIADEAKKMNTMVQKLLTLNQIEFGNTQLDFQRFDICQLIRNKIQSSQILIQKNRNRVIFQEEDTIYVWADEFMIEEVFSNYFSNALHHVTPGGDIRIWIERVGEDVRIHVFNQGRQIPEEDLEKLWIKFYKVDKARTREYGGSGIGLSIVAATMNAHGKGFGVNNVEDGVDFYFDLDCKAGEQQDRAPDSISQR